MRDGRLRMDGKAALASFFTVLVCGRKLRIANSRSRPGTPECTCRSESAGLSTACGDPNDDTDDDGVGGRGIDPDEIHAGRP